MMRTVCRISLTLALIGGGAYAFAEEDPRCSNGIITDVRPAQEPSGASVEATPTKDAAWKVAFCNGLTLTSFPKEKKILAESPAGQIAWEKPTTWESTTLEVKAGSVLISLLSPKQDQRPIQSAEIFTAGLTNKFIQYGFAFDNGKLGSLYECDDGTLCEERRAYEFYSWNVRLFGSYLNNSHATARRVGDLSYVLTSSLASVLFTPFFPRRWMVDPNAVPHFPAGTAAGAQVIQNPAKSQTPQVSGNLRKQESHLQAEIGNFQNLR